jgi:hypothetical protein
MGSKNAGMYRREKEIAEGSNSGYADAKRPPGYSFAFFSMA